jgi:peptidyl-prolyl cis-trans isomerase D
MMRTMRSIAPWIMAIVAVSFVGWMVFEVGMDVRGQASGAPLDEIARVNGQKIDVQTFYAAVRQAQEMAREQGAPTPRTLEEQRRLEDDVLEQLVQRILLDDEYRRHEITVTDEELRQALRLAPLPDLRQVEIFQTDGEFDLEKYQRYLFSGADPGFALALEARYREELPRVKYFERIAMGANVSDATLWQVYRDQNDSATATMVALVPAVLVTDDEIEVSEEELQAYFDAHAEDFEQPPQAFLSYVTISREPDAADSATALERAQAIRGEILAGTDFEAVAARESADSANRDTGGDLGEVERGAFVPPFEEAALALRTGELSQPVLTRFGYHIIRLESRQGDTYHPRHILIPIELYGGARLAAGTPAAARDAHGSGRRLRARRGSLGVRVAGRADLVGDRDAFLLLRVPAGQHHSGRRAAARGSGRGRAPRRQDGEEMAADTRAGPGHRGCGGRRRRAGGSRGAVRRQGTVHRAVHPRQPRSRAG